MRVHWILGSQTIGFSRPHTYFVLGVRGSGKSTMLEHVGECYLRKGHKVLDLFGSETGKA